MTMGNVVPIMPTPITDNVIELTLVDGKLSKKGEVRYNKDGSIDKRKCNKVAGVSTEVYAFTSEEEIKSIIDVLDKHIEESDGVKRQIACRNKMMFLIGINVGLRASDITRVKWNFFLNDDGTFKDFYSLQPKKTRKQGKFVKMFFNKAVKKAITDYIDKYPIEDMDEYLFKSRKGNEPISEASLWRIIKNTAEEAGIKKNIGSHSLRKTWGYHVWHEAEDKNKALVTLQFAFNHSSTQTTMKYIGLLDSEIEELFYSIDLGLDCL